jgi:hypothetical protein
VAALPGVAERAATARAVVDDALRHNVLRRRSAEVTLEAGLRSARATASLEGADRPLAQLRTWSQQQPHDFETAVVNGALRLSAEIGGLAGVIGRAPMQAFARLHVLAAADLTSPGELGRPREGRLDDAAHLGLGPAPGAAEVAARLGLLADLLAGPTTAPALVVSALVHGELLALRPFAEANGLVARAAAHLVVVSRGLDPKAVTAPEAGHADLAPAYGEAARAYINGDVGTWVEHCAEAIELGARETLAICAAIERAV